MLIWHLTARIVKQEGFALLELVGQHLAILAREDIFVTKKEWRTLKFALPEHIMLAEEQNLQVNAFLALLVIFAATAWTLLGKSTVTLVLEVLLNLNHVEKVLIKNAGDNSRAIFVPLAKTVPMKE